MAREINLVPDIKNEMLKALKVRNYILFLSIVVAAVSVAVTAITGLIMGGQQIARSNKEQAITALSNKLNSYTDLGDFLTIKDQLGNISTLTGNKKVLSRTFSILAALLPTGTDTIKISELSVNLENDSPTFTFDAQANAGKEPFIDYNVLEAFKKSMAYMRYDFGNYVDSNNNTIPAYCIIENGSDGSLLNDPDRGIYAYWTINAEGCNPAQTNQSTSSTDTSSANNTSYPEEDYEGQRVVRIWRTPQFNEWYKSQPVDGQPYMSLDGTISNVPHFVSSCITYSGDNSQGDPKWTETNDSCLLVPGSQNEQGESTGIQINDSSNGRGEDEELVLRFSAVISLNPAVYNFNNHHVIPIPPTGRRNVTDSYLQVQAMFSERAVDCAEGDKACLEAPTQNNNQDTTNNNSNTNGGQQNG